MKRLMILVTGLFALLTLFLAACAPTAVPAPQAPATVPQAPAAAAAPAPAPVEAAWQAEWDKTLQAAKAEGVVTIYSTAGPEPRFALTEAFKKKYGLRTEIVGGQPGELAEKLLRERRAGIYSVDVTLWGTTTQITIFKPAGALDPLEPALILPDAKDPKVWWKGILPWVDKDHMVLATLAEPEYTIGINTNLVQPGEVKGYKDLLNPKWKDKIILRDVSGTGGAAKWFATTLLMGILTQDYMRQLDKQKGGVIRDGRLQAEWLAHGKYAIAIAPDGRVLEPMLRLGVPVKLIIPEDGTHLSSGSSSVGLINRAPHPNAARLFANWFLTKEGQTIFSRAYGTPSRRLDVPTDHLRPEQIMQAGVKYFEYDNEEVILKEPELRKLGKEIFGIQ